MIVTPVVIAAAITVVVSTGNVMSRKEFKRQVAVV